MPCAGLQQQVDWRGAACWAPRRERPDSPQRGPHGALPSASQRSPERGSLKHPNLTQSAARSRALGACGAAWRGEQTRSERDGAGLSAPGVRPPRAFHCRWLSEKWLREKSLHNRHSWAAGESRIAFPPGCVLPHRNAKAASAADSPGARAHAHAHAHVHACTPTRMHTRTHLLLPGAIWRKGNAFRYIPSSLVAFRSFPSTDLTRGWHSRALPHCPPWCVGDLAGTHCEQAAFTAGVWSGALLTASAWVRAAWPEEVG